MLFSGVVKPVTSLTGSKNLELQRNLKSPSWQQILTVMEIVLIYNHKAIKKFHQSVLNLVSQISSLGV